MMDAINRHILSALKRKDIERTLMLLMTPGYDINTTNNKVGTPLIYATRLGLIPVIEKLVNLGANVNIPDKQKRTVLHLACAKGSGEIVKMLIKAGCDMYRTNEDGDCPIHMAACSGNLEAMQELLNAGIDINTRNVITKYTALELAVYYVQPKMVDFLLENEARIMNDKHGNGDSALHCAVQASTPNINIIKSLLKYGADVDLLNHCGETPFLLAVQEGNLEVMKALIDAGCNMNRYRYTSPLSIACRRNKHSIIKYLLSEGYNVSSDDSFKELIPVRLEESNPGLLEVLIHKSMNPLTLKEVCRLQIRNVIGQKLKESVPKLPIPKQLMAWTMADIIY